MDTTPKITFDEFEEMLGDPDVPASTIRKYLIIDRDLTRADSPIFRANRQLVDIPPEQAQRESGMSIGNGLERWRRGRRFKRRRRLGSSRPVIVSEGDSWFQFPLLIDDVIDHLEDDFDVWSRGAAGDTLDNMVFGPLGDQMNEYLEALDDQRDDVKAFLFSGAGNDVLGLDADNVPVIGKLLLPFDPAKDAKGHIHQANFAAVLARLKTGYEKLITMVRADPDFVSLPIIIHGYDYTIPGSKTDERDPVYAKPDEWVGGPMAELGIVDPPLQQAIVRIMIDALYDMMDGLAASHSGVHVVNVRGTLTQKSHWNDEIHATSEKYADIAALFKAKINAAI